MEESIYRVQFYDREFNVSEAFTSVMTSMGRCFTFNSNGTFKSSRAGARFGLYLVLKIDSDEYFAGPEYSSGIKVSLYHIHCSIKYYHYRTQNGK